MDGRVRGPVQFQGDVQGRDRRGLEEPVEDRVQEKEHRVFGHAGAQFPPALGPAHQGGEIFRGVAPHRGQEFLPERQVLIELNLEIEAENPRMFPGEGHPGQKRFFQAGEKVFLQGLFLDRGQGVAHHPEGVLEDIGKNSLFVGEILVERALGDAGPGHHAVQRGLMIALVGKFVQGGSEHPFLLVRGQVAKGGQGRFFTHDHLVISNSRANCQALAAPSPVVYQFEFRGWKNLEKNSLLHLNLNGG
jgi:hypothetical protein